MLPVDLAIIGESRTGASDWHSGVGKYMDRLDDGYNDTVRRPGRGKALAKTTAGLTSTERKIARQQHHFNQESHK